MTGPVPSTRKLTAEALAIRRRFVEHNESRRYPLDLQRGDRLAMLNALCQSLADYDTRHDKAQG